MATGNINDTSQGDNFNNVINLGDNVQNLDELNDNPNKNNTNIIITNDENKKVQSNKTEPTNDKYKKFYDEV